MDDRLTPSALAIVATVYCFEAYLSQQMLTTAAPHGSPWLPEGYVQHPRQAARRSLGGGVRLLVPGAHRGTPGCGRAVLPLGRCTRPSTRWPPRRSPAPRP